MKDVTKHDPSKHSNRFARFNPDGTPNYIMSYRPGYDVTVYKTPEEYAKLDNKCPECGAEARFEDTDPYIMPDIQL